MFDELPPAKPDADRHWSPGRVSIQDQGYHWLALQKYNNDRIKEEKYSQSQLKKAKWLGHIELRANSFWQVWFSKYRMKFTTLAHKIVFIGLHDSFFFHFKKTQKKPMPGRQRSHFLPTNFTKSKCVNII